MSTSHLAPGQPAQPPLAQGAQAGAPSEGKAPPRDPGAEGPVLKIRDQMETWVNEGGSGDDVPD